MASAKPTIKEKIAYALGDAAAGGITWKVMSIAFLLFFTNIFGLAVVDSTTLMLVARLFDVVTDPIMGALADRTRSRWGTYRPWLIFGAIPLGLVFALLLFTPDFSLAGKRIWAYSLYLLMMAVYTAVNAMPKYLSSVTLDCSTENFYWSNRLINALADAHYGQCIQFVERYQSAVFTKGRAIVNKYDKLMCEKKDFSLTAKANEELCKMAKEETTKALNNVLLAASKEMKNGYSRADN